MLGFRQILGRSGEDSAVKYLRKKRYRVIARNYRNKFGEIDIIAENRGVIAFIEVKTRSGVGYGSPKESVTEKKQRSISMVALSWLKIHNKMNDSARFDVVSIVTVDKKTTIELVKNAFDLKFG